MQTKNNNESTTKPKSSYNAEVTKEDLYALGKKGLSMDPDDDLLLQQRKDRIDFFGKDLDIPGRNEHNLTSSQGSISNEENNLFGPGGDRNENLETTERYRVDNN
ncbi:hypothetical protein HZY62_08020 [Maribacter polysiphoniae]|uniref:Uncharacterized protein n=1 Tax=Maribacter polysiphoniae TaxID=429344 RepID=A0A316E6J0_9FLAO|nr:hypothetical protein [Maribacter polysiphoniae]MBD1260532.1 hypothetical protein [Maribacter polysiphoniae]PWK24343.1 hypothetical protein LX92_01933 [Maribacter polysiphoniae]